MAHIRGSAQQHHAKGSAAAEKLDAGHGSDGTGSTMGQLLFATSQGRGMAASSAAAESQPGTYMAGRLFTASGL